MSISYEEIRKAALDLLSGREKTSIEISQYINFQNAVAELLKKREPSSISIRSGGNAVLLTKDRDIFLEVFWDLFRQGIITLGLDDRNPQFPFFRVSSFGNRILENQELYFFHDVISYEKVIREQIPDIDSGTMIYLKEAMQAFLSGCLLSSSVMVGVATEDSLERLFDSASKNEKYSNRFTAVLKKRTILQRYNTFFKNLRDINSELPDVIKEDLETNFGAIISIIRNFRNESGHPSGKIISREQCYINLQIFIPCNKKIYQLIDFFQKT